MQIICGDVEVQVPHFIIKTETKEYTVYEVTDDGGLAIKLSCDGTEVEPCIEEVNGRVVRIYSKKDYEMEKMDIKVDISISTDDTQYSEFED